MSDQALRPSRLNRTLIASALSATFLWAGSATAWAGGSTQPGTAAQTPTAGAPATQAGLQAQAEILASQIQADGVKLDQLGQQYGAAQIRLQQILTQKSVLSRSMAETTREVAQARQALKEQAILAYLAGGAPIVNFVPGQAGNDPSLTDSYAEIVAGGQKAAVHDLKAVLAQLATQSHQLASVGAQAAITVADLRSDQSTATATLQQQTAALSQVKGQLATLVAQVQAANQRAEQSAVQQTLAGNGQSLPTATTPDTVAPSGSSPTPDPTADPAPTSASTTPATSPTTEATVPSTTAAPTPTVPTGGLPTTTTTTIPSTTTTTVVPVSNSPAPGYQTAIAYARAQIGVPYLWGGASPSTGFDCSGLVMMAWGQAGVSFPHLAQDQYDMTTRVPIARLLPGDLVFYGTPDNVYHVGIYIGGGDMIDAPSTGQDVSIQSIYYDGLLGGGRIKS